MNLKESDRQQKPFILIVDDVPKNLRILGSILSSKGYHFTPAANGRQALKIIGKRLPDLILLDIMMPEMDGFEVCHQLKSKNDTKDVPVIFISALTDTSDKIKAFEAGGVDYITKPFQKEEVFARISTHLKLRDSHEVLKRINEELNFEIRERQQAEKALMTANDKIMNSLRYITDSLRYAKMIQRSLLSNQDEVKACLPDSFIIWMPKDIVGGDIFFVNSFPSLHSPPPPVSCREGGFIVAVIDCTGHGIPGALMTMIASSGLGRIVRDEACHDPAEILKRLNFIVKTTLQQDTDHASSDDGLDAAVCFVSTPPSDATGNIQLTFAGARLPMVYIHNDEINIIKGDKHSVGYKKSKRSDINFNFTNHTITVEKGMSFYMFSDGFADQLGGKRGCRFGSRQFRNLLRRNTQLPFEKQRDILLQSFDEWHRGKERQDDVTVVGFGF